ncbi:uncharacterized protein LOC135385503 [Ornithodoros turicata]|uniref:uncharacterized protein LOC135385503 n=1 Tax=Ornithodoros turicata TaxID=34597 RepID=UPI003138AAE2
MHCYIVLFTSLLGVATLGGCPTSSHSVTTEHAEAYIEAGLVNDGKAADARDGAVKLLCEPMSNDTLIRSLGIKAGSLNHPPVEERSLTVGIGSKEINYTTLSGNCECDAEKSCSYRFSLLIPVRADPGPEPSPSQRLTRENDTLTGCSVSPRPLRNVTLMLQVPQSSYSLRGCCTDDKAYATVTFDDNDEPIGVYQCSRTDVAQVTKHQEPRTRNKKAPTWDTTSTLVLVVLGFIIPITVLLLPIKSPRLKNLLRAFEQLPYPQQATEGSFRFDLVSRQGDHNDKDTKFDTLDGKAARFCERDHNDNHTDSVTLAGTIVRFLRACGAKCRNNAA